jgi:hypothetical protein
VTQDERHEERPPAVPSPSPSTGSTDSAGPSDAGEAASSTDPAGSTEPAQAADARAATARQRRANQRMWAFAAAAIVVAVLLAAAVDQVWAWIGTVLLATGTAATTQAATQGKSTVLHELVLGEQAPLSVTASLQAEHLLRLGSPTDPYYQEVIPVSGAHRVQVALAPRSEHAVVVRALRPVVVSRGPTRKGEPGVTSGMLPDGHFDVLLDADPPRLQPAVTAAGTAPVDLPVTLTDGEPTTFVLIPRTDAHEVDWRLEVAWSCADREGAVAVGLGRKPFRTTAETGW